MEDSMALHLPDDHKIWTYDDYCSLPNDGQRYEIIEGRLYVNPAPTSAHQIVSKRLQYQFYELERAGQALVFNAPFDVFLPGTSPVQPDLVVLTPEQRALVQKKGLYGVPTVIIEILSPGTSSYDGIIKLKRYAASGVPWYWLVDLQDRSLEVLRLQDDGHYLIEAALIEGDVYSPDAPFPVVVDLTALFDGVRLLEEGD
jgi:Uma2 family endonuclease